MTQFKEKSRLNKADINAGLFGYPVLMAADIVLYKSTLVPVGEDQRQHLELTRDIVARFNGLYGPTFPVPEAYIPETGARIMSVIALLDPPATIARKIKRCVTDSGNEIVMREDKPGISNLLGILSAITDVPPAILQDQYRGLGYGHLKTDVADAVIALAEPIQARFRAIRDNTRELDELLAGGAAKARKPAQATLAEVHHALGLIPKR